MATKMTITDCSTLGELISKHFADYEILFGSAPMNLDVTHGAAIEIYDNKKYGHGISVNIYPYVLWTDGYYKPAYFTGESNISLFKQ